MKLQFTFILKGSAKVLKSTDVDNEEIPYISVNARTYKSAVKKVLALHIPQVETEEDLEWQSIVEEDDIFDEEAEKQTA